MPPTELYDGLCAPDPFACGKRSALLRVTTSGIYGRAVAADELGSSGSDD